MNDLRIVSRRKFLGTGMSAGGGLLIAASFGEGVLAKTVLQDQTELGGGTFKPSVYVEIGTDNQIVLTIGKSEMGQGTLTGIAQLISDELCCRWDDVRVVQAPVAPEFGFPFNGFMITGGSSSLRTEWQRMREVGATARVKLVQAAANLWGIDPSDLVVKDGVISNGGGQHATFGELAADAARLPISETPALKPAAQRQIIGKPHRRLDTAKKITGQARYGIDVDVPDLLTAVVISPPQLLAPVVSFDGARALERTGVRAVVEISTGVAIVGDHYWAAQSARDDVDIVWGESPFVGIGMDELRAGYRNALSEPGKIAQSIGNTMASAGTVTITREIEQPYLAHACMEPMNFTVSIGDGAAEVWGPTQAQSFVQNTVGRIAGIDPKNVTVHTTFLGGGFGRRSAQDFVAAATEIALAVAGPVKLIYSREDDMRAGRYRPLTLTRATATLGQSGELAALDVKIAAPSVSKWSGLKFLIRDDGIDEQAVEGLVDLPYAIPNANVAWVDHDPGIPVHFWRAVGASHNPFVVETLLDDLARTVKLDPLEFRRRLLVGNPRYLAVLDRLAEESGWAKPVPAGVGRGMAIVGSFESIVAEAVELRLVDNELRIDNVVCVIDCGVAVNPSQVEAQMHSSIVFGLSAFLRGNITIDDGTVEQSNFHDYEPLRMHEMPAISVSILEGSDRPGGVGEPGLPPIMPAVANALSSLGVKALDQLPYQSAI